MLDVLSPLLRDAMARLPRYLLPGQPQHVIQRGNNRQAIFFAESDYRIFLEWLKDGAERFGCDIHAYVLMSNHLHLLLSPRQPDSLSRLMQSMGRRYVQYVNYTYQRTGGLWEGRYRATPIDAEHYLLACYRYIEMNPVRAGIVNHPRHYRWSSYRCHAEGREDPLVQDHPRFKSLGSSAEKRREAYRALFKAGLDEATLHLLRETVHKGWALGNDRFHLEIEAATKRRTLPIQRGGARQGAGRKKAKGQT